MIKSGKYYQSLYQLAAILNSARSPDDILRSIVEGVANAMNAKGCALMLLTPNSGVLLLAASYGLSDWFVRKGPVLVDKSMSETLKGVPVVIFDAAADNRIAYQKQVAQEGIASILSIPVKLREKVVGVMRIYTPRLRRFTGEDINFAEGAANFGALALESAHFYDTLQQDYDSLIRDLRQRRAEEGYEAAAEPPVIPAEEPAGVLPPGG